MVSKKTIAAISGGLAAIVLAAATSLTARYYSKPHKAEIIEDIEYFDLESPMEYSKFREKMNYFEEQIKEAKTVKDWVNLIEYSQLFISEYPGISPNSLEFQSLSPGEKKLAVQTANKEAESALNRLVNKINQGLLNVTPTNDPEISDEVF